MPSNFLKGFIQGVGEGADELNARRAAADERRGKYVDSVNLLREKTNNDLRMAKELEMMKMTAAEQKQIEKAGVIRDLKENKISEAEASFKLERMGVDSTSILRNIAQTNKLNSQANGQGKPTTPVVGPGSDYNPGTGPASWSGEDATVTEDAATSSTQDFQGDAATQDSGNPADPTSDAYDGSPEQQGGALPDDTVVMPNAINQAPAPDASIQPDTQIAPSVVPQAAPLPQGGMKMPGAAPVMETQGDGGQKIVPTAPLDKAGYTEALKSLKGAQENAANFQRIANNWDASYLSLSSKIKSKVGNTADMVIGGDSGLSNPDRAKFVADTNALTAEYMKFISGLTISEKEREFLKTILPTIGEGFLDGDGPVLFKAKLDAARERANLAITRQAYRLKHGEPLTNMSMDSEDGVTATKEAIKSQVTKYYNEAKKANPQGSTEDWINAARKLRQENLGL